ncbi:hypothetical protein Ddye_022154 [Dipteronia dyeriana]|uniref:RNase H type-1 domain-containing protein n=1 Tax=Dipteronia dyeriana TaxID=168575 RepID=A0AAD9U334_9ROSI|nr:hypothetical protein Ddye_022154 [Dipteronia dyeriana]
MRWRVGNESNIRVYGENWISRDNVMAIISPQNLNRNIMVDQLMAPSGGWDIKKLQGIFVQYDVDEILQIPTEEFQKAGRRRDQGGDKDMRGRLEVGDMWRSSAQDILKINCNTFKDKNSRKIGFGIVVRKASGKVLACSVESCVANYDLDSAKAMAVYKGLCFGKYFGFYNLVVKVDLETVINHIMKRSTTESTYGGILDSILSVASTLMKVSFLHILSQANRVAWALAKFGLNTCHKTVWLASMLGALIL